MYSEGVTAEDLLWNWTRWVWSGAAVGNMEQHIPDDDEQRPIHHSHAMQVEALHAALPWHERMVITAEYPQKNARFAGLGPAARVAAARRWIESTTAVSLSDAEYRIYLGLFKNTIERVVR